MNENIHTGNSSLLHSVDLLSTTSFGKQVYDRARKLGVKFLSRPDAISQNTAEGDIVMGEKPFGDYNKKGYAYKLREVYEPGFSLDQHAPSRSRLYLPETEHLIKLCHEMGHHIVKMDQVENKCQFINSLSDKLMVLIERGKLWGMSSDSFYSTDNLKLNEQFADLIGVYLFGGQEFLYAHLFFLEQQFSETFSSSDVIEIGVLIEGITSSYLARAKSQSENVSNTIASRLFSFLLKK